MKKSFKFIWCVTCLSLIIIGSNFINISNIATEAKYEFPSIKKNESILFVKIESNNIVQTNNISTNNYSYKNYTVKDGDILWFITEKEYGNGRFSYPILLYNSLDIDSNIYSGDKIKLPSIKDPKFIKLAKDFGIEIDKNN